VIEFKDYMIADRLSKIGMVRIYGLREGGVGKSTLSTLLGLRLRDMGMKTWILDTDLHGASIPFILGGSKVSVEAIKGGFKPAELYGIKVMSLRMFVGDRPTPLRGERKSEVLKYMLALTIWDSLDYLLVDLPPGMSDELLTLMKYVKGKHIVVTLPTKTSIDVTLRYIKFLKSLGCDVPVVVVNNLMNITVDNDFILREFQEHIADSSCLTMPHLYGIEEYLLKGRLPEEALIVIDEIIRHL